MNQKLIIGIVLGFAAFYYGYHYFQSLQNLNNKTVVIQSQSTDCTEEIGCSCSDNSNCLSGDCWSGECAFCRKISQTCYNSGQCCHDMLCDLTTNTPGTCGVGVLTTGAAVATSTGWYVGSGNLTADLARWDIGGAERPSNYYDRLSDLSDADTEALETTISNKVLRGDIQWANQADADDLDNLPDVDDTDALRDTLTLIDDSEDLLFA